MSDDTLDARRKRAEQLREKIHELSHPDSDSASKARTKEDGETSAEFVHRKMNELDKKKP
jgi:hypothetical protein